MLAKYVRLAYLVVTGLNHEQCRFVMHIEGGEGAAMLFRGVQQHRLVHCDANRQPRPQREQLQSTLVF
jgi:hypothetical protein